MSAGSKWDKLKSAKSNKTSLRLKLATAFRKTTSDLTPDELCARSIQLERECRRNARKIRKRLSTVNNVKTAPAQKQRSDALQSWFEQELSRRQGECDSTIALHKWLNSYTKRHSDIIRLDSDRTEIKGMISGEEIDDEKDESSGKTCSKDAEKSQEIDENDDSKDETSDKVMQEYDNTTTMAKLLIKEGAHTLVELGKNITKLRKNLQIAAKRLTEHTEDTRAELSLLTGVQDTKTSDKTSENEYLIQVQARYNALFKVHGTKSLLLTQAEAELEQERNLGEERSQDEEMELEKLKVTRAKLQSMIDGFKEKIESDSFKSTLRNAQRSTGKDDGGSGAMMGDMEALARLEKSIPELDKLREKESTIKNQFDAAVLVTSDVQKRLHEAKDIWAKAEKELNSTLQESIEKEKETIEIIEKESDANINEIMMKTQTRKAIHSAEMEELLLKEQALNAEANALSIAISECDKEVEITYLAPYQKECSKLREDIDKLHERAKALPSIIDQANVSLEKVTQKSEDLQDLTYGDEEELEAEAECEANEDAAYYVSHPPSEDSTAEQLLARNERENRACMKELNKTKEKVMHILKERKLVKELTHRLEVFEAGNSDLVPIQNLLDAKKTVKTKKSSLDLDFIEYQGKCASILVSTRCKQEEKNRVHWDLCAKAMSDFVTEERKNIENKLSSILKTIALIVDRFKDYKKIQQNYINESGSHGVDYTGFQYSKQQAMTRSISKYISCNASEASWMDFNKTPVSESEYVSHAIAPSYPPYNIKARFEFALSAISGRPVPISTRFRWVLKNDICPILVDAMISKHIHGIIRASNIKNLALKTSENELWSDLLHAAKLLSVCTENKMKRHQQLHHTYKKLTELHQEEIYMRQKQRMIDLMKWEEDTREKMKSNAMDQQNIPPPHLLPDWEDPKDKFDFIKFINNTLDERDSCSKTTDTIRGSCEIGSLYLPPNGNKLVRDSSCYTGPDLAFEAKRETVIAAENSVALGEKQIEDLRASITNLLKSKSLSLTSDKTDLWNHLKMTIEIVSEYQNDKKLVVDDSGRFIKDQSVLSDTYGVKKALSKKTKLQHLGELPNSPKRQVGGRRSIQGKTKAKVRWKKREGVGTHKTRVIDKNKDSNLPPATKYNLNKTYENAVKAKLDKSRQFRQTLQGKVKSKRLCRKYRRVLVDADDLVAACIDHQKIKDLHRKNNSIRTYVMNDSVDAREEMILLRCELIRLMCSKSEAKSETALFEARIKTLQERQTEGMDIFKRIKMIETYLAAAAVSGAPRSMSMSRYAASVDRERGRKRRSKLGAK